MKRNQITTQQFLRLNIEKEQSWVSFDKSSLTLLQNDGYEYFVFVDNHNQKKIFPFKNYIDALEKKSEDLHLPIQNNHIMCCDAALQEIALGSTMMGVLILVEL